MVIILTWQESIQTAAAALLKEDKFVFCKA